jgi:hypothetical protein
LDVFDVHRKLIDDYREFTTAFVDILDPRVKDHVDQELDRGEQWPEPWLSLNPMFESGGSITSLIGEGLLHPETERVFRIKQHIEDNGTRTITLHKHQREAVEVAKSGLSYVLTTGTGSGKSLAYIVPIVDRVLRQSKSRGVKAIIVYPMNALANSQVGELEKFLRFGYGAGREPVTFARYTGQEKPEDRDRVLADPPDMIVPSVNSNRTWSWPVMMMFSIRSSSTSGCSRPNPNKASKTAFATLSCSSIDNAPRPADRRSCASACSRSTMMERPISC